MLRGLPHQLRGQGWLLLCPVSQPPCAHALTHQQRCTLHTAHNCVLRATATHRPPPSGTALHPPQRDRGVQRAEDRLPR